MKRPLRLLPALLAFPAILAAQSLSQRVAALGDGTIRLSVAARPGVCGNGANNITVVDHDDDSTTIWPRLLDLARKTSAPMATRRHAIFWLGQAAGAAATRGLDSIAGDGRGDLELRKQAVFALSQRTEEEGVPALIRIARSNPYAEVRKSALFWLGQSEDPRALALFEELLR